jgi:opacity protein-like surface antigen
LYAGLFNVYYDIFNTDEYETNFIPYIGLGIGYGGVQNQLKYYYNQVEFLNDKVSTGTAIGQAILGINYFFDESWSLGTDFRYMVTQKIQPYDQRFKIITWNFVLNYTFDEA